MWKQKNHELHLEPSDPVLWAVIEVFLARLISVLLEAYRSACLLTLGKLVQIGTKLAMSGTHVHGSFSANGNFLGQMEIFWDKITHGWYNTVHGLWPGNRLEVVHTWHCGMDMKMNQ